MNTFTSSEIELASLPDEELIEHIKAARELWIRTQRACIRRGGADPDIFFEKSMPQSELFMCEIIPIIHELCFGEPQNIQLDVLDVGPQTFAGTRLLQALHRIGTFNNLKMKVTAVDIVSSFAMLKECICPDVEFIKSDIYNIKDRKWNIVIASHVVEHVPEPAKFIRGLQALCTGTVIVACPWNENPITTKGHQNTIDKAFVRSVGARSLKIFTNFIWGKTREVCIFTVNGTAARK